MIMCVLLCYPVSIRIYYQQGGLFLVNNCVKSSLLFIGETFIPAQVQKYKESNTKIRPYIKLWRMNY